MSDTGYTKGQCQNCGGHLEFPVTGIGQTINCPHCGWQTPLVSRQADTTAPAGNPPAQPGRKFPVVWVLAVSVLILAAAGGAFYGFKKTRPHPPAATQAAIPTPTNSETTNRLAGTPEDDDRLLAGPVTLQKTEGSALVHAVGTVRNNSGRQRFGVKITLDLLDAQDNRIGTASDYIAILEPRKEWQFRALLTQPRAVKAKVAGIEEQK